MSGFYRTKKGRWGRMSTPRRLAEEPVPYAPRLTGSGGIIVAPATAPARWAAQIRELERRMLEQARWRVACRQRIAARLAMEPDDAL